MISITDGQIYLQTNLFFQGQRPAVDVGISVSRVGGDAQYKAMKQVAGTLRLDLAAYRDKQAFAQFGSDLDATTQYQLNHGAHMMELLKQGRFAALAAPDEIIAVFAGKEDFLDDIDLNHVSLFRDGLAKYMADKHPALRASLLEGKITEDQERRLKEHITHYKAQFMLEHPNKAKARDVEHVAEKTEGPEAVAVPGQDQDAEKGQE